MTATPPEMTVIPPLSFSNFILQTFERWKFTPLLTFFVVLAFNVITNIGLALYFHAWGPVQTPSGIVSPGLSREPAAWMILALGQPMIFATAAWLRTSADKMTKCLIARGSVKLTNEVHEALLSGNRRLHGRPLFVSAWIIGLLLQVFGIMLETGVIGGHNPTWINVHPVVFWLRAAVGVLSYYMLAVVVFCLAVILMTLNRLMAATGSVVVQLYHPDEAGGLGAIGRFAANLGYLALTFGVAIVVLFWQARMFAGYHTGWLIASLISSVAYAVIAPVFFFLPLLSAHRAMVSYRDDLLQKISDEINQIYHSALQSKQEDTSEDSLARIKYLDELREHTMRFPTWPFSSANLRKYYSLAVSPVISSSIGLAYDWLSNRIVGP